MSEKKADDLAVPRVLDKTTGKPMTNEELEIATSVHREEQGKCGRRCTHHARWCELKRGHNGFCTCEECKKDD